MTISRNISVLAQGASTAGILAGGYGGLGASISPTAAGNVLFTTNGIAWSSTQKIVQTTLQNTTSGTSIDFTSIPSWIKRVTVILNGVSTNGTSPIQFQLGTSGGFVTSGYSSGVAAISSAGTALAAALVTSGFYIGGFNANTDTVSGTYIISNLSGNIWGYGGTGVRTGNQATYMNSAVPQSLSGALTQIRLTTLNGTDTFDAGSVNILYE